MNCRGMIAYEFLGVVLLVSVAVVYALPCAPLHFSSGIVCVCNASYCDTLENVEPQNITDFVVVSSSRKGMRFFVSNGQFSNLEHRALDINRFQPQVIHRHKRSLWDTIAGFFQSKDVTIKVDRSKTYQSIVGFGGAFTGAVSWNLDQINTDLQNHVYTSFYSKDKGIAFNMMRLPIGGCDFDFAPWAYNEYPVNDTSLSNFTQLDPRDVRKIEQIKELMKIAEMDDIKFYGTAWSPPPWMKTNNDWTGLSALKPEYYQTWADYHLKWLRLMKESGIPFWGISTGNEPINGVISFMFVKFMSLGWTPEAQAKWVAENYGPALRNSEFKDIILMGPEDQRITLPNWLETMEKTVKGSTDFLDGISVHWYLDSIIPVSWLAKSHKLFENKLLLNTESCVGSGPLDRHKPLLGNWNRAEIYIDDYISDFKNYVNGWIIWNLILDEQGGPNYVRNYVDAPIIRNDNGTLIYKQPLYYAIGHFSRFMQPDSVRVDASSTESTVRTVAFKRPDGSIALIVHNSKGSSINLEIEDSVRGKMQLILPEKSIHTVVYK